MVAGDGWKFLCPGHRIDPQIGQSSKPWAMPARVLRAGQVQGCKSLLTAPNLILALGDERKRYAAMLLRPDRRDGLSPLYAVD